MKRSDSRILTTHTGSLNATGRPLGPLLERRLESLPEEP